MSTNINFNKVLGISKGCSITLPLNLLLLDTYPNAAVAYSLRKLRDGYKKVDNLLSYSEDISQTTYSKSALITTSYIDIETAPNGTMTADKLIEDTSFANHFLTQTLGITVVGLDYNFSVYLKAAGRNKATIQAGTVGQARINLLTGSIETTTFPITPVVTDAGNGWWRFSVTFNASSTLLNPLYRIFTVNALDNTSYVGDGVSGVYVWGFQLTQSSTVLPYEKTVVTPETGAAIRVRRAVDNTEQDFGFDINGDLDTTTLLDFVGYNLWTYSEQLNQSVWTKTQTSVVADIVVAPDGLTTADVAFETIVNSTHSISRGQAVISGNDYSVSFYIKDQGRRYFQIRSAVNLSTDNATTPIAMLDLTTATVISNNGFFRIAPTITSVGSGWYKIEYGLIANSTATSTALIIVYSPDGTTISYLGDGTKGMAIWGLQISQTLTVKTYQKTVATAGGNAFVRRWYDQSGNGNNAAQDAVGNQAQIVLNGNLVLDPNTGKISTLWTSDFYNTLVQINMVQTMYHYMVFNRTSNANTIIGLGRTNATLSMLRWFSTTGEIVSYASSLVTHAIDTSTGANLITTLRDTSNIVKMFKNAIALSTGTSIVISTFFNTWGSIGGVSSSGYYSELVHWNSINLETNRTGIETNINDYYNVY